MSLAALKDRLREKLPVPDVEIPPTGQLVELPGRGTTYLTDIPGPPGAPTIVLLHAVGCTGMLTWFTAVAALAEEYRVVVFDQRWHGRGIQSEHFVLQDCADDVAAVLDLLEIDRALITGYSMGSIIAQRVWRQHPDRVAGLVLCATTPHFRSTLHERAFHQGLEVAMGLARQLSFARTVVNAARSTARALDADRLDLTQWALREFRSTSPWAVAQAVAALGRHHSRPWLHLIDVPTAVVVTAHDRVIPASRQRALASAIPAATMHEVPIGHAGIAFGHEEFLEGLLDAVHSVEGRARVAGLLPPRRRRPRSRSHLRAAP
ncbi:MAG: alpha/beta hydrolase [Nocardioides sp.]|nr:alpha/beta hydrolase [Nocardioides sp.]